MKFILMFFLIGMTACTSSSVFQKGVRVEHRDNKELIYVTSADDDIYSNYMLGSVHAVTNDSTGQREDRAYSAVLAKDLNLLHQMAQNPESNELLQKYKYILIEYARCFPEYGWQHLLDKLFESAPDFTKKYASVQRCKNQDTLRCFVERNRLLTWVVFNGDSLKALIDYGSTNTAVSNKFKNLTKTDSSYEATDYYNKILLVDNALVANASIGSTTFKDLTVGVVPDDFLVHTRTLFTNHSFDVLIGREILGLFNVRINHIDTVVVLSPSSQSTSEDRILKFFKYWLIEGSICDSVYTQYCFDSGAGRSSLTELGLHKQDVICGSNSPSVRISSFEFPYSIDYINTHPEKQHIDGVLGNDFASKLDYSIDLRAGVFKILGVR